MTMIAKGSSISQFQTNRYSIPFVVDQVSGPAVKAQCCPECLNYLCSLVPCHFGCGLLYCSTSCRSLHDKNVGHWFYCNGRINGKQLCLTRDFLSHATIHNEHFRTSLVVVSKIIANAIQLYCVGKDIRKSLAQAVADFLTLFPSSLPTEDADSGDESDAKTDIVESYSLLQTLLEYEKTPSAGIPEEEWRKALPEISLVVYQHIVNVVSTSMVPVRLASPVPPLLEELKKVPLLPTFKERREAVQKHLDLANAASSFLIPTKDTSVKVIGELTVSSEETSEALKIERLAARLAQAADLASTSDSSDNPLSGHVYTALCLIPAAYCVPCDVPSCTSVASTTSTAEANTFRLVHSCIPNTHLELVSEGSTVKVQAIALRNIQAGESLTYCYVDSTASVKTRQASLFEKLYPADSCCINSATSCYCSCLKCIYELSPLEYLNKLLAPFLESKQVSSLQEGLDWFEGLSDRLLVQPSASSVVTVCSTPLSQFLLMEVLKLCQCTSTSDSVSPAVPYSFAALNDAVTLADAYMQDSKVEQALILYCCVLLHHYYHQKKCSKRVESELDRVDRDDRLINLVGDVVLSVGNALLDISIQPPETHTHTVTSTAAAASAARLDYSGVDCELMSLIEMVTSAPYQLSHTVWRSGAKFVGNLHSGVNTHIKDRQNYDFNALAAAERPVVNLTKYHQVFVSEKGSRLINSVAVSRPSIYLSESPILTSQDCQYAIQVAEEHAAQHMNGSWTTSRHYAVPTTDIPIQEVPLLLDWFRRIMREVLEPMLRSQFVPSTAVADDSAAECCVAVHDAFIVKYQSEPEDSLNNASPSSKQRYLPLHSDQSTHSLTIALNAASEYEGGGTYFVDLDTALRPERGHVLSFRGDLMHGGDPVTSGTRYILAIFLLLKTDRAAVSVRSTEEAREVGLKRKWLRESQSSGGIAQVFKSRQPLTGGSDSSAQPSAAEKAEDAGNSGGFSFSFM